MPPPLPKKQALMRSTQHAALLHTAKLCDSLQRSSRLRTLPSPASRRRLETPATHPLKIHKMFLSASNTTLGCTRSSSPAPTSNSPGCTTATAPAPRLYVLGLELKVLDVSPSSLPDRCLLALLHGPGCTV